MVLYSLYLPGGAPYLHPNLYAKKFSGKYIHKTITGGIGHNLPQEAPKAFADAIIEADGYSEQTNTSS